VRANDVVTRINRTPVSSMAEFERVVNGLKPGGAVVLELLRYSRTDERPVQRIVQFSYQ